MGMFSEGLEEAVVEAEAKLMKAIIKRIRRFRDKQIDDHEIATCDAIIEDIQKIKK